MKRSWLWLGAVVLVLALVYLPSLGVSGGQVFAFLLLLACPLLHLLGLHRHGDHGQSGDARSSAPPAGGRDRDEA